jgi:hypothetical protein
MKPKKKAKAASPKPSAATKQPQQTAPENESDRAEMTRPALTVRMIELATLTPYARNARLHSDEQVKLIASSLERFGWMQPLVIDSAQTLIVGHGRVLAAELLAKEGRTARGIAIDTVPCVVAEDLTDDEIKAYRIADNKLALNAGWDFEALSVEIDELNDQGFDLTLLGFQRFELNEMIGTPNDPRAEWAGMPSFTQDNQKAFRDIVMHFPNESAAREFAELLGQSITEKTKYLWFPKAEPVKAVDKLYVEADA